MPITAQLNNRVLALMPPDSAADETILKKPCVGFLAVSNVDTVKKMITVL